jgi:NAD(P)-dependent dehydrogenase (short-subunit alcohol dehydrogenase family)
MNSMTLLGDKVCIVTGSGRGIGKAIALEFSKQGASLVLCSRTASELQSVAAEIVKMHGVAARVFTVDVSDFLQVSNMVSKTIEQFGRIDVLVNNAGVQGPIGLLWNNDLKDWKRTIEINLFGTVHCCKAVIPYMIIARKGKIINVSGSGEGAFPRFSSYSCSKSAIVRLTETLAAELAGYNVQVNALAPGAVKTKFLDQVLEAGLEAGDYYEKAVKQRAGGGISPSRAAQFASFLASDNSAGLTGRLFSASWDNWQKLDTKKIASSSLYQMRRIDGFRYRETTQ